MSDEKPKGEDAKAAKAEKGDKGEGADKKAAKKPINKKIIIIAAILVADLGIMAGLGFFIVGKLKGDKTEAPAVDPHLEEQEAEKAKKQQLTKIGMVLPKPLPFTVNIGSGAGAHYLKCAIQLEWDGHEPAGGGGHGAAPGLDATGHEIEKRMPKITDIIINILSSQTYEDLLKPSGKQKMKEAIVTEINAILPEPHHDPEHDKKKKDDEHAEPPPSGKLRNAFFTEFIVQ